MLLGSLVTGSYTVTRTAEGTTTAGRYTPGATSTFLLNAIEQPFSPRTLLPLPEGVRSEEVKLLHTSTLLRTRDNNGEADFVTIRGEDFYAWQVAGPYIMSGSSHYEIHVARRRRP